MNEIESLRRETNQILGCELLGIGSPSEMQLGVVETSVHKQWEQEAYEKYKTWSPQKLEEEITRLKIIIQNREKWITEQIKQGWAGDFGPSRDELAAAEQALGEKRVEFPAPSWAPPGAVITSPSVIPFITGQVTCPHCNAVIEYSYPKGAVQYKMPGKCPVCNGYLPGIGAYQGMKLRIITKDEKPSVPGEAPPVSPIEPIPGILPPPSTIIETPTVTPTMPIAFETKDKKEYLPWVIVGAIISIIAIIALTKK